jgi:flavin-dependent dehydrogenase
MHRALLVLLLLAGCAQPDTLSAAETGSTVQPRWHAVLVAGDAGGYEEPFTGEGMSWALASGAAAGVHAATCHMDRRAARRRARRRPRRRRWRRRPLGRRPALRRRPT